MSAQNLKVIGYALMGLGAIIALFSLLAIYDVYQANASTAALSDAATKMLGSYGAEAAKMAETASPSYFPPIIGLLIGAGGIFGGVKMLGKANTSRNMA